MANDRIIPGGQGGSRWRMAGWGFAAFLLLLPFMAMRVTDEVDWSVSDFLFAAVMFGGVGLAFEYIVRKSGSLAYRSGAALALAAAFLTIWVNGAVGMIGSEDNPYNFLFGGVLFVALIGAVLARLQPADMTRAMAVTAVAQGAVGAGGLTTDVRGAAFSIAFAGLWLLSAALFRNAALEN